MAAIILLAGCAGNGTGVGQGSSTWTVTTAGGSFQSSNQVITMFVPAGAVTTTTTITNAPMATAPTGPTGTLYINNTGYTYTPTVFNSAVSIQIPFATSRLSPAQASTAVFYTQAPGSSTWVAQTTTVNTSSDTATVTLTNLNPGALFYRAVP